MTVSPDRNRSGVADEVLSVLRCLSCCGHLEDEGSELACIGCGRKNSQINDVIRFVDEQQYAGSFGFQWHVHACTQLDTTESKGSERAFRSRTGFHPEELADKLVLDGGCGMGRFADVATQWRARVLAIDLSLAAGVAAHYLAGREATIFQADVFHPPFVSESFDFIYSIGVLHHTPDCERAFKMLPELLKPGARIAIWLYSGYNAWYRMSDIYRKVTRRMAAGLLHALCFGEVPLYGIHKVLRRIPLMGRPTSGVLAYLVPMAFHPDRRWRIQDTFDWYSLRYQSEHTYEEVFRWFESCGMDDLTVIEQPIAVQARRPFSREPSTPSGEKEFSRCAE